VSAFITSFSPISLFFARMNAVSEYTSSLVSDRGCVQGILYESRTNTASDAQNGEYVNLVTKGIIDPTKVVGAALQNAASIAGLLISTEAMVAERPKKESGAPGMPGGG
jgi:chaperonin GroEL